MWYLLMRSLPFGIWPLPNTLSGTFPQRQQLFFLIDLLAGLH